jgi:molecular chaperone GrpE
MEKEENLSQNNIDTELSEKDRSVENQLEDDQIKLNIKDKEKEEAFDYGGFTFAKEALNLIDNLERSRLILENDDKLKETEALKKMLEHLNIINKDLISTFTKNNIKPIDCLNKKLDPNFHQAMMEIEDNQKEPGTIVQEVQKGFMIKDRLLRPSLVGVSKKIEEKNSKDEENKENLDK